MNREVILHMLSSMRAQIEALIFLVADLPEEEKECQHPPDQRINLTTMGAGPEKWQCRVCGYEHST